MRACILTIGNEILKGRTVNTNAAEIGRMLYFSGYEVYRGLTVPDVREEIGGAFRSLVGMCDVIVSSGGLGPTFDDMTLSSFAEEFKISMVLDQETLDRIKNATERRGQKMTAEREKMAKVPKGSLIIKNEVGSAPGIEYRMDSSRIFILPGVPSEMRSMLKFVESEIKLKDSFYYEDSVLLKGIYEATLAPFVSQLMKKHDGQIYIKSHPIDNSERGSVMEVEVSARCTNLDCARNKVKEVLQELSEGVGRIR